MQRTDLGDILKLTAVVYAAFFFSFISYLMHLETTTGIDPRVSLERLRSRAIGAPVR